MPTFDVVVLGCGGGPSECNLSSYLLKPHDRPWCDGLIALEAGVGALAQMLRRQPDLFGMRAVKKGETSSKPYTAAEIYSWIKCYLITHAHLDHVNGLVLSAGALRGPPRKVHSTHQTLMDLETVFSDRLWPNLTSWDEQDQRPSIALVFSDLYPDGQYRPITEHVSVRTMPLSHGRNVSSPDVYESAAYFIRHDPSGKQFLFFGDVEPDSISGDVKRNQAVWDIAANMIPQTLSTVFIECSWPLGRPDDTLYGHLNPEHLVQELTNLATAVWKSRAKWKPSMTGQPSNSPPPPATHVAPRHARKRQKRSHSASPTPQDLCGVLSGLRVVITHCKEDLSGEFERPINEVITEQVRTLVDERGLGADVIAAVQGMQLSV